MLPAPFFSQLLLPGVLDLTLAAVGLFCLMSSSIYLLNNLEDRGQGRFHLEKRHRPLAADALPVWMAQVAMSVLERPVERLGFAQVPCPTTRPLENLFYPNAVNLLRTAERMLDLEPTDVNGESFYSHEQRFKGPF